MFFCFFFKCLYHDHVFSIVHPNIAFFLFPIHFIMEMHILTHRRIKTRRRIGSNIHTHFHTSHMSVGMMSTNDINPLFLYEFQVWRSIQCWIYISFGSIWNFNSILNFNDMRYCRICSGKDYKILNQFEFWIL